MTKYLFGLALVVASAASNCDDEYKAFLAKFPQKEASTHRKSTFCKSLEHIDMRNSDSSRRFKLSINEFSDWTEDEFRTLLGGHALNYSKPDVKNSLFKPSPLLQRVDAVDWRYSMPAIKNQGTCGSCWAFAAIDVVDFQAVGSHSEQQLVDCSPQDCSGGDPYTALKYLADAGSDEESTYPYIGESASCSQAGKFPRASISNVQAISGEDDLAAAVSTQAVAVCINAGSFKDFQSYESGVYDSDCGSDSDGHCVGVVGYTEDYWIIRNSWGTNWGQDGYMYFKRGSNLCNIGYRGAAVATATDKPWYASCDTSGGGVICTCTTGCGLLPGESTPCVAKAGTDCSAGFSGATCCSRPACAVGKPICTCTTGCGLGNGATSSCACDVGTDCSGDFSGCTCCDAANLAGTKSMNMTGGHNGGAVPDARFGGCGAGFGSGSGSAFVV